MGAASLPRTADFCIAGAGIVGVNIASVLRARFPSAAVTLLDKEPTFGAHASGRNSGVLHAGMYYAADSMKARLTQAGNRWLADYCARRGLPLRRCGKLIVARGEADLPTLDALFTRAAANGVPVEEVTLAQARAIEPRVRTHGRALWSPTTAVGDPLAVLRAQLGDATAAGVDVRFGTPVTAVVRRPGGDGVIVTTPAGRLECGHFINAAGLYADRLAHALGFGDGLTLLPFKGLYLYSDLRLATLVYPVPDISRPFLGVHFTTTVDGATTKIGPTAIPALWREHYGGMAGFSARELAEVVSLEAAMLLRQPDFRALAATEVRKYARSAMVAGAAELVDGATPERFTHYGRPGIRAQLVRRDAATGRHELVMDYVLQGDASSTHVLNATSPGWTTSRPFAELVCDAVEAAGGRAAPT